MRLPIVSFLLGYLEKLRFPWLFLIVGVLFGVDLVVPDFIPFADELLLGAMTLLLGAWRGRKSERKLAKDRQKISGPDPSSNNQSEDRES
ncbi:DUF6116 family protein [Thalassoglobus sp. JC818]|uniref:DUF6116 family protein n=1 Tax=Thalassoglobus sp. JC818 TaxID=3232136 RepID=UPI00345B204A